MSYLRFDKTLMINLEESLPREILRTNKSGAYHCTTIVDCNTRKYHGLLVIPVPNLDDENHVLLSSLDETVIQHGAEFNLGLHKYQGDHFSPNGHKYIREFDCEHIPATTYRVGGVILRKEKIFVHQEEFEGKEQEVLSTIHKLAEPDVIDLEPGLALIAVVGRGMRSTRGTAGRIFSALAHVNVNVKMIDQGSSELNIIIGVKNSDFETALKAIYDIFVVTQL